MVPIPSILEAFLHQQQQQLGCIWIRIPIGRWPDSSWFNGPFANMKTSINRRLVRWIQLRNGLKRWREYTCEILNRNRERGLSIRAFSSFLTLLSLIYIHIRTYISGYCTHIHSFASCSGHARIWEREFPAHTGGKGWRSGCHLLELQFLADANNLHCTFSRSLSVEFSVSFPLQCAKQKRTNDVH